MALPRRHHSAKVSTKGASVKLNKPEDIVANLAHMFKKYYIETDCQAKLTLREVNTAIRECFAFNGDTFEQGEKILELAKVLKPVYRPAQPSAEAQKS